MTAINPKTAAHKPKMTAISQKHLKKGNGLWSIAIIQKQQSENRKTTVGKGKISKGQWFMDYSYYLEITVGKSENNSRKRKDKQWIEDGSWIIVIIKGQWIRDYSYY